MNPWTWIAERVSIIRARNDERATNARRGVDLKTLQANQRAGEDRARKRAATLRAKL